MEVEKAIFGRRSVRQYTDQTVDRKLLQKVLKAGIWAPSGGNKQPWAFIGITDRDTIHQIRVVSPGMLWEPKALVCICSDQRKAAAFRLGPVLALFDCAMAAQNMMLRAYDLGMGSCVMRSTNLAALREILQAPENLQPELLIMFGYPAVAPQAPPRDEGAIHWEKFGTREG